MPFALLASGAGLGIALILLAYHLAESGAHVDWYAASFFVGVASLFSAALAVGMRPHWRATHPYLPYYLGIASYLPVFLRAPDHVYRGDEFAHYGQAWVTYLTGHLFPANPLVPVSSSFPGFELAVDGIRSVTGLSMYRSGTLLITGCHIMATFALYHIAKRLVGERGALLATLLYAISPQFISDDSMFSYETLGLPLALIAVAIATELLDAPRHQRRLLWALGVLTALSCVVTHHVSSYVMLAMLFSCGIGGLIFPSPNGRRPAFAVLLLTAVGALGAAAWVVVTGVHLGSYLFGGATQGLDALYHKFIPIGSKALAGKGATRPAAAGFRSPEQASGKPPIEILLAEATPVLWLVACGFGIWRLRRRLSGPAVVVGLMALAYFLSLPLLFLGSAQTTAHRSWAFTYVGLACLGASAATTVHRAGRRPLPEPAKTRRARAPRLRTAVTARAPGPRVSRRVQAVLAVLVLPLALAVSAYGVGVNVYVQYPGPPVLGADGRTPADAYAIASWLIHHSPGNQVVLADARIAPALYAYDRDTTDATLSAELLLKGGPVGAPLRRAIQHEAAFVVSDSLMTQQAPINGVYIFRYEGATPVPLPPSYLSRLKDLTWLTPVRATQHFTVYRVTP
jgi:hypothetical protein